MTSSNIIRVREHLRSVEPALPLTDLALWGAETLDYYLFRQPDIEKRANALDNIKPELEAAGVDWTDRTRIQQHDTITAVKAAALIYIRCREWCSAHLRPMPNLWLWNQNATTALISNFVPAWRPAPSINHELQHTDRDNDQYLWRRTGPDAFREKIDEAIPHDWADIVLLNVSEGAVGALSKPNATRRQRDLAAALTEQLSAILRDMRPQAIGCNYGQPQIRAKLNDKYLLDRPAMDKLVKAVVRAEGAEAFAELPALCMSAYDSYQSDKAAGEGRQWMREVQLGRIEYNTALMRALDSEAGLTRRHVYHVHHRHTNSPPHIHKLISYEELWSETIRPILEQQTAGHPPVSMV